MKSYRFVFVLLCLLLQSCVLNGLNLSLSGLDAEVEFEKLIEEQQFSKAYALLEDIRRDPYYSEKENKREEKLLKDSQQFEKDVLGSVRKSIKKGRWQETQALFDDALDKYPTSRVILDEQEKYFILRNIQLSKIEFRLLQNEARLLIDNTPLKQRSEFILGAGNSRFPELSLLQKRKDGVGVKLLDYVVSAIDAAEYDQAIYTIDLLNKLDAKGLDENVYSRVRKKTETVVAHRKRQKNKGTVVLMDSLKKGYSLDNLRQARRHLDMLQSQKRKYPTAYKLYPELKSLYDTGMQELIRKGSVFYSQGRIKEALAQWEPILEIDSEYHPLSDYIKRAEQVLRKVESLRDKDGSTALPTAP